MRSLFLVLLLLASCAAIRHEPLWDSQPTIRAIDVRAATIKAKTRAAMWMELDVDMELYGIYADQFAAFYAAMSEAWARGDQEDFDYYHQRLVTEMDKAEELLEDLEPPEVPGQSL